MKGWTMKWKCTFEHRECSVFFSSLTEFGVSPLSSKLNQGGSKVAVEPKPKQHSTQSSIFNEHFRTIFSEGKIFFHRTVVGGVTAQSLVCFYWEGYTSLTCYKFHVQKRAKERERDQMIRGLGRYPVITSSGWLGGWMQTLLQCSELKSQICSRMRSERLFGPHLCWWWVYVFSILSFVLPYTSINRS